MSARGYDAIAMVRVLGVFVFLTRPLSRLAGPSTEEERVFDIDFFFHQQPIKAFNNMAADGREKPIVSFLGPVASYSHQAVKQAFPEDAWQFKSVVTIDDVFDSVQNDHAIAGLVPFENSTNGSVVFTLDDFADRHSALKDIVIHGEVYVDVHHCLVGRAQPASNADGEGSGTCTPTASDPRPERPRTKPLSSLKHVRRLYSHPQAFGQCNAFITTYLKGVEVFEVSSTSKAAEIVSQDETGTFAAISSQLASELYKLDLLGQSIEDRSDNTTRFLIIGRHPEPPKDWRLIEPIGGYKGSKSMVSFTVPHDSPGGLAEALSCFKRFDLNLTSISSRPSLVKPFQYIFFVEFEGHRYEDEEGRVKGALEAIGTASESWRWLGSWKRYR